jgi:SsrA-binding protein
MQKEIYIQNRKAKFDYHFLEQYEAGIALVGTEVKSIKAGKVSLVDSYCFFDNGELFVKMMNITPVDKSFVHEPTRIRKLLLHKKELRKLEKGLDEGITIVVTSLKTAHGKIKCNIALAKGKKDYDKRETIKKREADRYVREEC